MEKQSKRLARLCEVRPLVFVFSDGDALLQFIKGCRRLRPPIRAVLYRLSEEYRLLWDDPAPIPPSFWALVTEHARVRGGWGTVASTIALGKRVAVGEAEITVNECDQ